MIPQRFTARSVLGACAGGFGAVSLIGGFVMSMAEGTPYTAGVWLVFNIVTTMGFGEGPSTALGQLIAAGAFITAAACWFGFISVAVEVGLSRFEHDSLVREAVRPLAARRGPKLFHNN